jgi:hypothetical protein
MQALVVLLVSAPAGETLHGRSDSAGTSTERSVCSFEHAATQSASLGGQVERRDGPFSVRDVKPCRMSPGDVSLAAGANPSFVCSSSSSPEISAGAQPASLLSLRCLLIV